MNMKLALLTTVLASTVQASSPLDYKDTLPACTPPYVSPQRPTTPVGMEGLTSFSLGASLHTDPVEALREVVQLANQYYADDEKGLCRQETMVESPVTPWSPVPLSHKSERTQVLSEEASLKRAFRAEQPPLPPSPCHTPLKPTKHGRSYSVVSADGSNESTPRRSTSSLVRRSPLGLSGFAMK